MISAEMRKSNVLNVEARFIEQGRDQILVKFENSFVLVGQGQGCALQEVLYFGGNA